MNLSPIKQLKMRYITVLVALGVLAFGSYILFDSVITRQETGAAEINIAGRQRMLSQRIVLLSNQLSNIEVEKHKLAALKELTDAIGLMRQSHIALTRGSLKLGLHGSTSDEIRALYFGPTKFIDNEVRTFLALAERHYQELVGGSDNEKGWHQYGNFNTKEFLKNLDDIVTQYQIENEAKITQLQIYQILALVLTLFLLGGPEFSYFTRW